MTQQAFSKLVHQDYLDTRKWIAAILGILALVTVLSSTVVAFDWPIVSDLLFVIAILAVVLIIPAVVIVLGVNYWQSMYGARGYFTFSIPTPGRNLYFAKVLYASVAALLATLVTILAAAALVVAVSIRTGVPVGPIFQELWDMLAVVPVGWQIALIVAFVAQIIFFITNMAAIMSVGAQSRFSSLGFAAPVIGAIIFYVATQVIDMAAVFLIPIGVQIGGPDGGQIVFRSMASSLFTTGNTAVVGLGTMFTSIIVAVGMAIWAVNAIEKHTSLR